MPEYTDTAAAVPLHARRLASPEAKEFIHNSNLIKIIRPSTRFDKDGYYSWFK
jgi:hypothetical protein